VTGRIAGGGEEDRESLMGQGEVFRRALNLSGGEDVTLREREASLPVQLSHECLMTREQGQKKTPILWK